MTFNEATLTPTVLETIEEIISSDNAYTQSLSESLVYLDGLPIKEISSVFHKPSNDPTTADSTAPTLAVPAVATESTLTTNVTTPGNSYGGAPYHAHLPVSTIIVSATLASTILAVHNNDDSAPIATNNNVPLPVAPEPPPIALTASPSAALVSTPDTTLLSSITADPTNVHHNPNLDITTCSAIPNLSPAPLLAGVAAAPKLSTLLYALHQPPVDPPPIVATKPKHLYSRIFSTSATTSITPATQLTGVATVALLPHFVLPFISSTILSVRPPAEPPPYCTADFYSNPADYVQLLLLQPHAQRYDTASCYSTRTNIRISSSYNNDY